MIKFLFWLSTYIHSMSGETAEDIYKIPSCTTTQHPYPHLESSNEAPVVHIFPGKLKITASAGLAPPKLIRFPTVILTAVDIAKLPKKLQILATPKAAKIPRPPPLVKMPIYTRKDKRSIVATTPPNSADTDDEKSREPPKKRVRTGNSESGGTPPTRKIIQEIFGTDKSKRPKGKGRKRRRGVTTPKKKAAPEQEVEIDEQLHDEFEADEHEEDENPLGEQEEERIVSSFFQVSEDKIRFDDGGEPETIKSEVIDVDEDNLDLDDVSNKETDQNPNVELDYKNEEEDDTISTLSLSRRTGRRKAKLVANEKLKTHNPHSEQSKEQLEVNTTSNPQTVIKEEAGEIHRRRSTTDTSSKSSGSGKPDSECSVGVYIESSLVDRQRDNPTPVSIISEDDYRHEIVKEDGEEHMDTVSVSDLQEQKDSDVDSTYSWKPVRAAAALALEQVTKKQGTGGSIAAVEGDIKTSAAAERRARKIQRYKGKSRRSLLFKSSSSKKFTTTKTRYSAQPTTLSIAYHNGAYFQTGDIVFVELDSDIPLYGQVTGILMDASGEISVGIRWLASTCSAYDYVQFNPRNYALSPDVPEKLIKINHANFVMRLNPDYYYGHHSFDKIEVNSIYSRVGRPLYSLQHVSESSSSSDDDNGDDESSDEEPNSGKSSNNEDHMNREKEDETSESTDSTDVEDNDELDLIQIEADSENGCEKQSLQNIQRVEET